MIIKLSLEELKNAKCHDDFDVNYFIDNINTPTNDYIFKENLYTVSNKPKNLLSESKKLLDKQREYIKKYHRNIFKSFSNIVYNNIIEIIEKLQKYVRMIFGTEVFINFDMRRHSYKVFFIIDEVIIENTVTKESLLLKDLVIIFIIGENDVAFNIKGTRLTVSVAEYIDNYLHSHLPSVSASDFDKIYNFCLGNTSTANNESIINSYLKNNITNVNIDSIIIEMLYGVKLLAKTESKEGIPYKYIKDVIYDKTSNTNFRMNKDFLDDLIKKKIINELNFVYNGNKAEVDENVLEQVFIEKLGKLPSYKSLFIPLRDSIIRPQEVFNEMFKKKNSNIFYLPLMVTDDKFLTYTIKPYNPSKYVYIVQMNNYNKKRIAKFINNFINIKL